MTSGSRWTAAVLLAASLAVSLATTGCRSDGGFDRRDNEETLQFAWKRVCEQTQVDANQTAKTIGALPTAMKDSFGRSLKDLSGTWHLYLDNHEPR